MKNNNDNNNNNTFWLLNKVLIFQKSFKTHSSLSDLNES